MAKKKDRKDEKLQDLSPAELQVRLDELRESHFRLQFRHASSPLKNPMQIRASRRQLARIKTVLRQKQGVA